MKINREGRGIIQGGGLLLFSINILIALYTSPLLLYIFAPASFIFFLFICAFFREPGRPHLKDDSLVYSPADGEVVVCEQVYEQEHIAEERIQLSVFMSITNVHVNWFPVKGRIEYFRHHHGRFLVAWHPKSSEDNERTTTVINTGREKILFRQVAGIVARRIVSYARVGADIEQNSKCGFIKFGSRLDLMLPVDCEILVRLGDKVVGSQTPVARLKRQG